MTRALVLQHIACEPPGVFEDVLREHAVALHRVELDEGDALPDWRDFDLIVAMGGPMSVNDDASLPWLTAEKRLIGEAVRAGVPYWGACLGVQLLAASLGARVYAGPQPEVGLLPVELTEAAMQDPVFAGLPSSFVTLQWHGDTFDLPDGTVRLAGSPAYPNQAFRWGHHAFGVQFHVEVSVHLASNWADVPEYSAALDRVLGPGSLPQLIEALAAQEGTMAEHARAMFGRWLTLSVGAAQK
jgi:GMP synthase-like glutamine amidotransferase